MKTRMKLWSEYRKNIENNISLQKSNNESNERLRILKERLFDIFPDYYEKFPSKTKSFKVKIEEIKNFSTISNQKIENLIKNIDDINKNIKNNFTFIDDISFKTNKLNDIIKTIKNHDNIEKEDIKKTKNIEINKLKVVKIDKNYKFKIAIDGPSASGKSVVARKIANLYDLNYVNTGLVYRAIAFYLLNKNINIDDQDEVKKNLINIKIKLLPNEIVDLNDEKFSIELRADIISQNASLVSSYSFVREFASLIQKDMAKKEGVIMEGRDTTFNIMPNADLKIFLDTRPEIRAKRRLNQNKKLGYLTNYKNILQEIIIRDKRDKNRKKDPLHKVKDAFLIDSSKLTIQEVIDKIVKILKDKKLIEEV